MIKHHKVMQELKLLTGASKLSSKERQKVMLDELKRKFIGVMAERGNLPRAELEYVVEKAYSLRDERLKAAIIQLIGWGDDVRAEVETMIAILLEVAAESTPSKFEVAAKRVELRYLAKQLQEEVNGSS